MAKKMNVLIMILILILLTSCSKHNIETLNPESVILNNENNNEHEVESIELDYEKIKPNEAGQIMVLMYHSIDKEEKIFTRTPNNFKKDLETLYDQGYRPISLEDYATGNIELEAGFSPVVLTFDDGNQNNFNIIEKEDGNIEIDPLCAVAILDEFHNTHPDFPLEATFFINNNIPFKQQDYLEYKLKYIVEKGMDIGNHTANHINFADCNNPETIKKEITKITELVATYLTDYEVNTLSLPYGGKPQSDELKQFIISDGNQYNNIAIVEVGWDPYKSPYDKNFNPYGIHRVRASDLQEYVKGCGFNDWLQRIEKGERLKFISDGNPNQVTVPEKYKDKIDINKLGNKELITYSIEDVEK